MDDVNIKRVIILGVDGLSAEGFQKSEHPNLDIILQNGVLSLNTVVEAPSITLPNWTSHLTSGGTEQHRVTSNNWTINSQNMPPIEQDELGYYPSIFKVLKEQIPTVKTAFYYNWAELINSINKNYLDEHIFENNDNYTESYNRAYDFIIENKLNPTLIFLYTVHVDHVGHQYKWMSPEYIKSIEDLDIEIGKLITKLKSDNLYGSTNFLLLSDHGGISYGHGGSSIDEMEVPWAITGPEIRKSKSLNDSNRNANTAKIIATLFGIDKTPKSWIGRIPKSIFE